jgi:mannosyl-3-phosphoglycerate phosphatase
LTASGRPLLVATDLDACLLDEDSYSHEAADRALSRLADAGVPVVVCSSKTRAEIAPLREELGLTGPYVVENGGAVVLPDPALAGVGGDEAGTVVALGVPAAVLARELGEIAAETGLRLTGFSSLSPREVEELTGLSGERSARALRREWDEPFLVGGKGPSEAGVPATEALAAAAEARGLRVTQGSRFHHLTGQTDKGCALRELLGILERTGRRFQVVALGDAPNDVPMLRAADRPIVVPRKAGVDPLVARLLPDAERAPAPGPAGWAEAVLAVLDGRTLPTVGGRTP